MGKVSWLLIGLITGGLLVVCVLSWRNISAQLGSLREEQAPTAKPPEASAKPVRIAQWASNGTKSTESFEVRSDEWAVTWSYQPSPDVGGGAFQVFVYKRGDEMPHVAVNTTGAGRDQSVLHDGPGTFWLEINSLGNWQVAVWDNP